MAKRRQSRAPGNHVAREGDGPRTLWVSNKHHSAVVAAYNGPPLDPPPPDLVLRPMETKAVDASVWGNSPSLRSLEQMGLVAVKGQEGVPPSYPSLSSITDALPDPRDRGVALDVVFGPEGMAMSIINMTPYTDDSRKVVDRGFLTGRHLPILRAALSALEELGQGDGERAQKVRAKIKELEGLEEKLA